MSFRRVPGIKARSICLILAATVCLAQEYSTIVTLVPDRLFQRIFSDIRPYTKDHSGNWIIKGQLRLGSSSYPYVIRLDDKQLQMDTNGDGQIGNDPNNTWMPGYRPTPAVWLYRGIRLTVKEPNRPLVINVDVTDLWVRRSVMINFKTRSVFTGTLQLEDQQGKTKSLPLTMTDLDTDGYLDVTEPFEILRLLPDRPKEIFVRGDDLPVPPCNYQLDISEFPKVTLRRHDIETGMLDVGPYLRTLQLESSDGNRVIRLDLGGRRDPNELVGVPVGTYLLRRASIRLKPGKELQTSSDARVQVEIKPGTTNRFVLGPPFRHDVTATRVGGTIRVTDLLKGASGESYDFSLMGPTEPPSIQIFKGGRLLASDKFRFG